MGDDAYRYLQQEQRSVWGSISFLEARCTTYLFQLLWQPPPNQQATRVLEHRVVQALCDRQPAEIKHSRRTYIHSCSPFHEMATAEMDCRMRMVSVPRLNYKAGKKCSTRNREL